MIVEIGVCSKCMLLALGMGISLLLPNWQRILDLLQSREKLV
jgi:hypothetical protein